MRFLRLTAVFCIATLAIFAGHYAQNTRKVIASHEGVSEELVTHSLRMVYDEGADINHSGGFMFQERQVGHAYLSQFGLQYSVLARVPALARNYHLARVCFGLFTAAVLALIVCAAYREFGAVPALVTGVCLAVSEPLAKMSSNLYWTLGLMFAPLAFACVAYPRMRRGWSFGGFCLGISVLVCLKSLCGYELLSSVLAGVLVPLAFYEARAGSRVRVIAARGFVVMFAGCLGFVAALALHIHRLVAYFGGWDQGMAELKAVVTRRTIGASAGTPNAGLLRSLMMFFGYFFNEQQAYYFFTAIGCVLILRARERQATPQGVRGAAWLGAAKLAGLAAAASLSWNMLAWGHMRDHFHVDYLTFFLPFNLVTFILAGYVLDRTMRGRTSENPHGSRSGV